MGSLSTGGGSSAVAASAHAGCERYRHTDPMVTGLSRRKLAREVGAPDTTAGIPEGRWMRAMAFERLVQHEDFVSKLLTTAVGALGLDRPADVHRADGRVSVEVTAEQLQAGHDRAVATGSATMITGLAVPFVGFEGVDSTPVKPDFAIVVPRPGDDGPAGSWLVMGDAKDYERVRSRIDDGRMLKGFLQVALGAESAAAWSRLPEGMEVHRYGALAVPRNAFLQPVAIVELLDDHRREVTARADERGALLEEVDEPVPTEDLEDFVAHRLATFDPATCASCALFEYCQGEVRASADPEELLVELGIRPELRGTVSDMVGGGEPSELAPPGIIALVTATLTGLPVWTGLRRVDPVGQPGSINVVLAKSDAAALGVHGVGVQHVEADGSMSPWVMTVFDDPQSPATRLGLMAVLGVALEEATAAATESAESGCVHLVVPDTATADVLASIADSLAGVETSRLRWQRDLDEGRPALTFDGEAAVVPKPLSDQQRLAVSFLLEEDRSRAMTLRCPIVDLRRVLGQHVVAGGPSIDSGRLDYLVEWAEASEPLDHRAVSDGIRDRETTSGARLANERSDDIHRALRGRIDRRGKEGKPDPARYQELVLDELGYKADILTRAFAVLDALEVSVLRDAYLALEAASQEVWRRRLALHASDLVRFGRTSRFWRDDHVGLLGDDRGCGARLQALTNPDAALDAALAAGTRELATAEVVSVDPLRVVVRSRRIGAGSSAVALHVNGDPCVERPATTVQVQKGSIKLSQQSLGPLVDDGGASLLWELGVPIEVKVGDEVVLANADWFNTFANNHQISIDRPSPDTNNAPSLDCTADSFEQDPDGHRWCCQSHEASEAAWADELAARRARGELNPEVWPPVVDVDQFDTPAAGSATDGDEQDSPEASGDLTMDDLE